MQGELWHGGVRSEPVGALSESGLTLELGLEVVAQLTLEFGYEYEHILRHLRFQLRG